MAVQWGKFEERLRRVKARKLQDVTVVEDTETCQIIFGQPGQWLVDFGDGDYDIYDEEEFFELYREVDDS